MFLVSCARPLPATEVPATAGPAAFPLADGAGAVELHLDLDAVAEAAPWEGRVVQRAPSGALVFRDPATFAIQQVVVEPAPATAIGIVGGALYAGFADGRVARIEPTGDVRYVGVLTARPTWVGAARDGVAAVAIGPAGPDRKAPVEVWTLRGNVHRSSVLDFSRVYGGIAPPVVAASADTLFVGWDWGEWGGAVARIGLVDGAATMDGSEGVYGIASLSDGIWAFGGGMHMGMLTSSLRRLEPAGEPEYGVTTFGEHEPTPNRGPRFPITHVLEGPSADELTVLAYSDVYRVDRALTGWKKVGTLDLLYSGGRPDAVGTYPSVTAAWLDAGRVVVGTRFQGFRRLDPDGRTAGPPVPAGTGRGLLRVLSTREGLVVVDRAIVPRRIEPAGLRALATPWEGEPYGASWDVDGAGDLRATLDSREGVFTLDKEAERTTVTWSGDEAVVTRAPAPVRMSYVRASDGALFGIGVGKAWIEEAGRWVEAPRFGYDGYGFLLRAVEGGGRYFVMRDGGALWRWAGEGAASIFERVRDEVDHAVVAEGRLYAATHGEIVVLDAATGASRGSVSAPRGLLRLAADGCGRVWLAGEVLGVLESGRLRTFPDAPGLVERAWIEATGRPEGVALTDGTMVADVSWPCSAG
ncbi:MAG: hypothetical protein ACOZNI_27020 [Myxococcota bacterium]